VSEKKSESKPDWVAIPEDLAAGGVALVVGAVTANPALGLAAGAGVKSVRQAARAVLGKRTAARFERFEEEVFAKLSGTDEEIEAAFYEPNFEEVLFQNYRRVMDAMDAAVVPALGRLTAMYRFKPADQFFRGAGRLLQDLSTDELAALREVLSAARKIEAAVVSIVSWESNGTWELRCSVDKANDCIACKRHPLAIVALRLLERNGLLHDEGRNGQDMALTGNHEVSQVTIERLIELVGEVAVQTYPAKFVTK
jgi:hypothetical protein